MSYELKPCPFCSDEAKWSYAGADYIVFCPGCGASTDKYDTVNEAIEAWNTRAERTCSYVEHCDGTYHYYQCSECQYEMDGGDFELYRPNYCMDCGAKIDEVVSYAD